MRLHFSSFIITALAVHPTHHDQQQNCECRRKCCSKNQSGDNLCTGLSAGFFIKISYMYSTDYESYETTSRGVFTHGYSASTVRTVVIFRTVIKHPTYYALINDDKRAISFDRNDLIARTTCTCRSTRTDQHKLVVNTAATCTSCTHHLHSYTHRVHMVITPQIQTPRSLVQ